MTAVPEIVCASVTIWGVSYARASPGYTIPYHAKQHHRTPHHTAPWRVTAVSYSGWLPYIPPGTSDHTGAHGPNSQHLTFEVSIHGAIGAIYGAIYNVFYGK